MCSNKSTSREVHSLVMQWVYVSKCANDTIVVWLVYVTNYEQTRNLNRIRLMQWIRLDNLYSFANENNSLRNVVAEKRQLQTSDWINLDR